MKPQPDIDEIATFVRVVRHGSLAGAAAELGVPKSTVSRRVARLEGDLNTQLLHRAARRVMITAEGKRLYDRVAGSVDTIELALSATLADADSPRGHIRLTAPSDFGRLVLIDELISFAEAFPEITVELMLADRFIDLAAEGFDLAVRAGHMPETSAAQSLITRHLTSSMLHLAGTADLAARVTCLEDLGRVPFVLFRTPARRQRLTLEDGSGRSCEVTVEGRFVVHDYVSMVELVGRGAGLGLMPSMHVGRGLTRVLPDLAVPGGVIAVVYPTRRLPARVRALIEHLTRRLR